MEVTIRTDLPNFTDEQVAYWYSQAVPIWEMIAVAIESFKQQGSQDFFTETLGVMCANDNWNLLIEIGEHVWSLIYPWLVQLYRKCPAFYGGTVSRIEMFSDERSLNIQLYVDDE